MSVALGTFTTYSAVGNREDLSDVITNISPEDTPFMTMIGTGKPADATVFEWQTDSLAPADNTNAQIQGDDITDFGAVVPTVRVGNRTQISRKLCAVSGTQEAVDKAGRKAEMGYQMAKKSAELKLDMEKIMIGTNQGAATGNVNTPPKTAALLAWVKTNVSLGATGTNPTYTSGVPAAGRIDGTPRAFTEALLKTVLALCYTNGSKPKVLMLAPAQKTAASAFTGIATRYRDVPPGKQAQIIGAADVYVGDFGQLDIVPNRLVRSLDGWIIDPKMAEVSYLRPFFKEPLAKTGDAQKMMLAVEWGLRVKNEAGFGLVADLL